MRCLFLHPVFPGQFHGIMEALANDKDNEVVHCSEKSAIEAITGVKKVHYTVSGEASSQTHPFVRKFEDSIRHGQAVCLAVADLKKQGFVPDVIYGYAGWGPTFFMKDLFPQTPLVGYGEWFLNAFGSEYNFDPNNPLPFDYQTCLRAHNAGMLLDLTNCDKLITPTNWQKQQFPESFHHKITVLHEGVDTDYYCPQSGVSLRLPGVDLSGSREIITFVTRGMEPFRGFPQFMRALAVLQKRRPQCHAVIVGSEEVFYSKIPEGGQSYKDLLLQELAGKLDLSRIHFTGWLQKAQYRKVLRASAAHVYLTYPYVLSWSLLEAMATGCLVIGSRTPPVEEVIRDGQNGLLVDFFKHEMLADRIEEVLAEPERWKDLRANARETILDRYASSKLLPRHVAFLKETAGPGQHRAGGRKRKKDRSPISVIVCSYRSDLAEEHRKNVLETIGYDCEYVRLDNSLGTHGICAAYNKGVELAHGHILAFIHEDVFLTKVGWGKILAEKFRTDNSLGLVGVAGTQYLFADNPFWGAAKNPFLKGRVLHEVDGGTRRVPVVFSPEYGDSEVVAVDGLFFAMRRSLFDTIRFDDRTFDKFHFYDLDICMQARRTHRLIVTTDISVKHLSGGTFDAVWQEYGRRFLVKYRNDLPASCAGMMPRGEHQELE